MKKTTVVKELEKLISFRPVTTDTRANRALLEYVEARLISFGMQCKLVIINGHTSLIAGTRSLTESKVLLQGHVDVVPASDDLFTPRIQQDRLIGRGASDMLFGVAMFIAVLEQLSVEGVLAQYDIGVILTSDEETGGFNGVAQLIKDYTCDVCILPDAGDEDRISTAAKGVLVLSLEVKGSSGHAARPWDYQNPIPMLTPVIQKLQEMFQNNKPNQTTCSLTKIEAGEALNQVPDTATLFVDIRYSNQDTPDLLIAKIKRSLGDKVRVGQIEREPGFIVDPKNPYIESYRALHKNITGRALKQVQAPGSSDARFFPPDIPIIMTRPRCANMHGPNEWVSIQSLEEFVTVNTAYVKQFATIEKI